MPERAKCKFCLFYFPLNPGNFRRRREIPIKNRGFLQLCRLVWPMARFRNCDVLWSNGRVMTGKEMSKYSYKTIIPVSLLSSVSHKGCLGFFVRNFPLFTWAISPPPPSPVCYCSPSVLLHKSTSLFLWILSTLQFHLFLHSIILFNTYLIFSCS